MLPPKETLWKLDPATVGKHLVLRNYLDVWLPKMMQTYTNVLYIDAFAGPGEYRDGEPGSPIIALRTYLHHTRLHALQSTAHFVFIEMRHDRVDHLRARLAAPEFADLTNATKIVRKKQFSRAFEEIRDRYRAGAGIYPTFAMIDPFGYKDVSLNLIGRLLDNQSSEVFLTFMDPWINRSLSHEPIADTLNRAFGSEVWKYALEHEGDQKRADKIVELYVSEVRGVGADYVVRFDINRTDRSRAYTLIHATKSDIGCDVMKQAMWQTPRKGDFRYVAGDNLQKVLFDNDDLDLEEFGSELEGKFGRGSWHRVESLKQYARTDATRFHSGHVSRALRQMENSDRLAVRFRKAGGYPDHAEIKFTGNRRQSLF